MTDAPVSPLYFLAIPVSLFIVAHLLGKIAARDRRRADQVQSVKDRLQGRPPEVNSQALFARRSSYDWLMERMFPSAHYPSDFDEKRTYIHTEIRARLDVADRLRLLLTADLRILVTTYTDVEVKSCRALSNIEVQPFKE